MPPHRRIPRTHPVAPSVLLAAGLLLAACSSASPQAASSAGASAAGSHGSVRVAGAGTSAAGSSGVVPLHGPDNAPSGETASSGGAGGPSGSSGGGNTGSADTSVASQALSRYLQAIVAHDPSGVTGASDAGAFAYAAVQVDTAAIDSARGTTTTVTLGPSSLAPSGTSGSVVTFGGSVTLTTTISGPKGSGSATDTISGPLTVADEAGTYRVTSFSYDGSPLSYWTESATQTVSGLQVTVGYVVSYGSLTVALIGLAQPSGSANVTLQSCTLSAGSQHQAGVGDFTGPPTPVGVLRFARAAGQPSGLALHFTSSSGQIFSYSFSL